MSCVEFDNIAMGDYNYRPFTIYTSPRTASMKTLNQQTTNANVTDEQSDSFIDQAPRLKEGGDAIKDYILGKVLSDSLPAFGKYGAGDAEKHGLADGKADGEVFSFQNDCRNAFRKVKIRVSKTIAGIVNREKDDVEDIIRARLPDMEQEVERKIDRNAVLGLMRAAEALNNALRKHNKFLCARGLSKDSPQTKKGVEYTGWKFWLPLGVIVLFEFLANYWFLEGAAPFQKFIITIGALMVIYGFGFAISFCLKARQGIPIENNQFASFQKAGAWTGVGFFFIAFAWILQVFIFYRAGIDSTNTGVLSGLAEAVNNNITDLYLALANIIFLVVAICTFYKADWQIHKYGDVANEVEQCQNDYEAIRANLDKEAMLVFDSSMAEVKRRQKSASLLEMDWPSIVAVCKDIPSINHAAITRIDEKYKTAIKRYREGFKSSRTPIAINPVGRDDIITLISKDLRVHSPIKPLMENDSDTESITAKLPILIDIDFANELAAFKKWVDDWESANEKFDKLDEFAQKRIKRIKEKIHCELQDDEINTEQDSQNG